MRRKVMLGILVGCILSFGANASSGISGIPILLTIDDSDPSAVTLTATTSNSYSVDNGNRASTGVDLLGFFGTDEQGISTGRFSGGNLQGGNDGVSYDSLVSDNYSTGGGLYYDLEVYLSGASAGSGNIETFSTNLPAFSGTWTVDLSSLGVNAADLPVAGSEGSIISGNNANSGAYLGEWQVLPVPEPAPASLLALGATMAWVAIRRQRTA
jgi:hypothetical protein